MHPISWQQLEYFLVVARTQHISRAANEVGLSQPALSRAISNLEINLKVPLFQRIGRSITLTRFGEVFQRRVERALHEIDDARAELIDLASAEHGKVELGFMRTLGIDFLPNVVRRFNDQYPNVRFGFVQSHGTDLEEKLVRGELDVIFVSRGRPDFKWTPIQEQELILIVPLSHPLAGQETVALSGLSQEKFVSLKPGHRFRDVMEGYCDQAGFRPSYSFEGDDFSSVIGFVSSGFGIAMVAPEYAMSQRVASVRLIDPVPKRFIGIGWLDNRYISASARLFREFIVANSSLQKPEDLLVG